MGARMEDVTGRIDFDQAGANFYTAAREGLGAQFLWLDGRDVSAQQLILDELLPMAEAGLRRQGIIDEDIKRYLGTVDQRVRTGRTGARWLMSSWAAMKDKGTPGERANALVAATVQRQQTGRPVSEWERARIDEAEASRHNYLRVDQYMSTDLFTVSPDDPVEMVANLMSWERIRHVPVEDKDHRLVGLVSYRAVLRHLAAGRALREATVSELMKSDVQTIEPDTPTVDAIRLMRKLRIGCMPVVHEGRLVGIVTDDDFLKIASKLLEERLVQETQETQEKR
jgi:CBS domain-containing protein